MPRKAMIDFPAAPLDVRPFPVPAETMGRSAFGMFRAEAVTRMVAPPVRLW